MVFGKEVQVKPVTVDRYDRTVAIVYVKDQCLNEEIIKNGFAWVYRRYCDKPICEEWLKLEKKARHNKIGLWSIPNPISPWEFRHGKGKESSFQENKAITPNKASRTIYHGNVKSKVFHRPGCQYYNCKNCTDVFHNREEAIKAGYRVCKKCRKNLFYIPKIR